MLIHTSASGHVWSITANPPAAYLYDFDIDGDKLKPDHKKWIDENVVDTLKKSAMEEWNLFIEGTASYTGDKTYNEGLSGRRAVEVYKYLLSKVSGKHLYHQVSAFGYRNASMAGNKFAVEDERDRTVTVLVQEKTKPPPPPIPHPKLVIPVLVPKIPMPKVSGFGYGPWGIKGFSSFTLTAPLIGVISAGGGTGVLQLENVDAKKVATYHMSGPVGALGFDLKKIPF